MASVIILRRVCKTNERGEAPIYLRIIDKRRTKFKFCDVWVPEYLWDEENKQVKKGYPNYVKVNAHIAKKYNNALKVAIDLDENKFTLFSKKASREIDGRPPVNFILYAEAYAKTLSDAGKIGVYRKTNAVINKLKNYPGGSNLMFHDMTYEFITGYANYLKKTYGNSSNTITSNFKVIRKIMNDGIKEEILSRDDNPFYKIKLRSEPSKREFLTEEELIRIEDLKLEPGTRIYHHRNAYVFAAYTGGLRVSDILQLKWKNFDGSHINIVMYKTNRQLNIKLPKKALDVLKLYKTKDILPDDLIFPLLPANRDYTIPTALHNNINTATTLANSDLKMIKTLAKIHKTLSFHTSRHTFATLALKKGIRLEYVSKLLGHSNVKETQVYAKIINEELDKAMDVFNEKPAALKKNNYKRNNPK